RRPGEHMRCLGNCLRLPLISKPHLSDRDVQRLLQLVAQRRLHPESPSEDTLGLAPAARPGCTREQSSCPVSSWPEQTMIHFENPIDPLSAYLVGARYDLAFRSCAPTILLKIRVLLPPTLHDRVILWVE